VSALQLKAGFSRFAQADPQRLHVAAHSHHPWPDVTLAAQQQAWHDAATRMDHKWEHVFGAVLPETQTWIARMLGLTRHVLFETGAVIDIHSVVGAVPDERPFVVVDGYHGFMALPTDLGAVEHRAFYLAGGYKYAMAGEGVCFAHCPPGYGQRPRDTGWFADFSSLEDKPTARVAYGAHGQRFLGATFDPTALYRFNAVQRWLADADVDVEAIHAHVRHLQERFVTALAEAGVTLLDTPSPVVTPSRTGVHGHLLAFASDRAGDVAAELDRRGVIVDHRGSHLRVGLGVYHDDDDIDRLLDRLSGAVTGLRRHW
jgi:selenocysteine lyase/cysteine desulfurase